MTDEEKEFVSLMNNEKVIKLMRLAHEAQSQNAIYREFLGDIYDSLDDVVAIRELFEKWNDEVDF